MNHQQGIEYTWWCVAHQQLITANSDDTRAELVTAHLAQHRAAA